MRIYLIGFPTLYPAIGVSGCGKRLRLISKISPSSKALRWAGAPAQQAQGPHRPNKALAAIAILITLR
jgi:hypothetical protein